MPESSDSSDETAPTNAPLDAGAFDFSDIASLDNTLHGWGQGKEVNDQNRPVSCEQYEEKYRKYDASFIMPATEQAIYLTFDQGYENGYTTKILDTLKEKQCTAVFFVTMHYAKSNPDLIKRMIEEGHVIGNHTASHQSMPTISVEDAANDIIELHNYILETYGYEMTLFRPPKGEWSERTLALTQKLGYRTVFWSFAYADYDVNNQMGVDKAFPKVTEAAHNGAIYLLHSVSKDNAEMLGDIIDTLRQKNYVIAAL
ncbi:polysaccharide deacetylase family protein [Phocea massiliensis]|uniref:Polysaccharide deacetylase family protein n=2 Tax=Merdimmobilis hominis TaxID=2897707 RepID=A0A939BEH5_9FIRM|nr:polysaccharide deacetylase family protein [Merdimmobilis hominis]